MWTPGGSVLSWIWKTCCKWESVGGENMSPRKILRNSIYLFANFIISFRKHVVLVTGLHQHELCYLGFHQKKENTCKVIFKDVNVSHLKIKPKTYAQHVEIGFYWSLVSWVTDCKFHDISLYLWWAIWSWDPTNLKSNTHEHDKWKVLIHHPLICMNHSAYRGFSCVIYNMWYYSATTHVYIQFICINHAQYIVDLCR